MIEVRYRNHAADCRMRVKQSHATELTADARKRGLIVYRLLDDEGELIPGCSIEMPEPGETREQCVKRLRDEFGGRLVLMEDVCEF